MSFNVYGAPYSPSDACVSIVYSPSGTELNDFGIDGQLVRGLTDLHYAGSRLLFVQWGWYLGK
jgi:hypothetical protein